MGISKTALFTESQNRLAALAKAIAHPARVAILQYLAISGTCFCGDIVEVLPLSQSTVSQHLKALKEVGLIKGSIEKTSTCYCINPDTLDEARLMLGAFFTKINCC